MKTISMKEARQALIGKQISFFDGWNGSFDRFTIGYVQNDDNFVRVYSERGKGWGGIYRQE